MNDDNTDGKGEAFVQIGRSREDGETLLAELQRARRGGRMSDVFRQPDPEHGVTFVRLFVLVIARVDLKAPYDELKAAHEDMKAKLRAGEPANAARDTLTAQVDAAAKALGPVYRFLIRGLLFNEGEEPMRDHLPRFAR